MRSSALTRLTLGAALLAGVLVPSLARAAIQDCSKESDVDAALCVAQNAGNAVQSAEAPLVPFRDQARTAGELALEKAGLCDPTDTAHCLLPFPSDTFTVADASTATGRRVNLSPLAMPRNVANRPIDPTEWNRQDGWSPGSTLLTSIPGLDPVRTGLAGIRDMGASMNFDAPIVIIDSASGERHPYWAELDANPTNGQQPLLIVRPGFNFLEGHRYVVGLRYMRDSAGALIPPNAAFAARRAAAVKALEDSARDKQRGKSEGKGNGKAKGHDKGGADPSALDGDPVFGPLWRNGYRIDDLYLAWTFTIASTKNNTGRLLHMRDDAFASLNGAAPKFTVDKTTANPDTGIMKRVTGRFTVPNYLNTPANSKDPFLGADPGMPGTRLLFLPGDDKPDRNGDFEATFTCNIPASLIGTDGSVTPGHGVIYGHGLLGGQGEVNSSPQRKMAVENKAVYCATDWYGMATGDVPNVATMLADMSNFPTLPDRAQQGMLAQLFLARLLKDPRGFGSHASFQSAGQSLVAANEVAYDGNSQGGIMGAAVVAVSQDITRGVLGVPGMNYSTLLDRSVDFSGYESVFNAAYPSEMERQIVFGLIQMLWDRGEGNGYAAHIQNNPLPGTPSHRVLLHAAFGDHQVANVSAEVEARTIGAVTNTGFLATGRHWAIEPGWGIGRAPAGPYSGSALVYWDSGSDTPPDGNVPPAEGPGLAGHDPHGDPRSTWLARVQKAEFLWGSGFVDVCGGAPCKARPLASEDKPV